VKALRPFLERPWVRFPGQFTRVPPISMGFIFPRGVSRHFSTYFFGASFFAPFWRVFCWLRDSYQRKKIIPGGFHQLRCRRERLSSFSVVWLPRSHLRPQSLPRLLRPPPEPPHGELQVYPRVKQLGPFLETVSWAVEGNFSKSKVWIFSTPEVRVPRNGHSDSSRV